MPRLHSNRNVAVALLAVSAVAVTSSTPPPDTVWTRHTIVAGTTGVGNFHGSDGVVLDDINGDGQPDVASGYEQGRRVSLSFFPDSGDPGDAWPTVKLPATNLVGPEDVNTGDVDGDGAIDLIVALEGGLGVSVLFAPACASNPPCPELLDPLEWTRVDLPAVAPVPMATMRVHLTDLNDDGDPDIVVGGKELNRPASVGYFSSPTPRVASSWVWHPITPAGWVMQMEVVDMDGDFDLDIVYTDRDPIDVGVIEPDTSKMGLRWLENDGAPTPDWTEHNISPMISPTVGERYHKWFTLDHWDSDGEPDIIDCRSATDLTPDNEMSIWLNGGDAASWTELSVPVPDDIGLCQHATVADVNTVGGKDLGFTFADAGELTGDPDTKSGVIWLKNSGTPTSPSWTRHEIGGSEVGIKYDNLIWRDLDDDGDLDALTSEQHEDTDDDAVLGPGLGVVWYENPEL